MGKVGLLLCGLRMVGRLEVGVTPPAVYLGGIQILRLRRAISLDLCRNLSRGLRTHILLRLYRFLDQVQPLGVLRGGLCLIHGICLRLFPAYVHRGLRPDVLIDELREDALRYAGPVDFGSRFHRALRWLLFPIAEDRLKYCPTWALARAFGLDGVRGFTDRSLALPLAEQFLPQAFRLRCQQRGCGLA